MGIKCIRKNFYSRAFNFSLFKYNREKREIEDPRKLVPILAFEITYVCALLSRIHLSRQ